MSMIDQIDFLNHDGVNRAMINDFMRNQFYDNIFADSVKDQHCVDIGFGTGLLSILALKHGAKSITAYESDPARFELGQLIIQTLKLEQITLIHDRYDHSMLDPDTGVVFSETVNGNLWQEGLLNSVPRCAGVNFLPGKYFLELYACVIPESFAQGLANPRSTQGFSPGIDLDRNFVNLVNKIGFNENFTDYVTPRQTISTIDTGVDTEWGWIPYMRLCVNNGRLIAGYCLNANTVSIEFVNDQTKPIDFDCDHLELVVDTTAWREKSVLLVPRVGMRHNTYQLMLDTGHWGPTLSPIILTNPTSNLIVTHNLINGDISYTSE